MKNITELALAKVPESKILVTLEKSASSLIAKAEKVSITSAKDMENATILLSELNKIRDKVLKEKKKVTDPLNALIKAIREQWKIGDKLAEPIQALRTAISEYQTEQTRLAEAEEKKITDRIGEGRGHFTLATAARKAEEIDTPEKQVVTGAGVVKFRKDKKFEVMDLSMVPLEFHLANEKAIREAMEKGIELTGVRYFEVQTPINIR